MARKKTLRPIDGQLQQGDVIFQQIGAIPDGAEAVKGATFAEGEGHHVHRAAIPADVTIYVKGGVRYARVHRETEVEHVTPDGRAGEHNSVVLPAGDYQFSQVQEWDYLAEMAREVVD